MRYPTAAPMCFAALVATCAPAPDTTSPATPAPRASQAPDTAFWNAMRQLDLAAARAAAGTDAERRCVDVLDRAWRGGSLATAADLTELGTRDADPDRLDRQRIDWARKTLLDLLRIEGRWDRLARLRTDHPELELRDTAVPAAMLALPVPTVEVAPAPATLPMVADLPDYAAVAVEVQGSNATASLTAIVDTGAGTCVIDRETAVRIGVRLLDVPPLPVIDITGARSEAAAGVLPMLRFGSITAHNVPVAVVDGAHLREVTGAVPFLVGWEVLRHAVVEIAGKKGEVVVRRSSSADATTDTPNLVLLHEPALRLLSGDTPMLFLLDTGAASTEARITLAQRLGWPLVDGVPGEQGEDELRGLGGSKPAATRRITKLPFLCGKLQITLGDVPAAAAPPGVEFWRIDGRLGVDVAFAVRVVIDGPNRRVEFRAE